MRLRAAFLKVFFATLTLLFAAVPAEAEMTATEWIKYYTKGDFQSRQLIERITSASEDGMAWYRARSKIELYCEPPKKALTGNQLMDILRRAVDRSSEIGEMPWALALLQSLERTFPCPNP